MKISLIAGLFLVGVGCASPSTGTSPTEPASGEDDVTKAPAFKGTGTSKEVTIAGKPATLLPISKEIKALVEEMTKANDIQNNQFMAAVYALSAVDAAAFSSPAGAYVAQKNMAYDFMYRADGSKPGSNEGFGWADKWNAEYEDMGCRATTRDKADARFKRFGAYKSHQGDDQIPIAKRDLIKRDATKLVASFLSGAGAGAKLYSCHWDNNDDTTSEALVLVDGTEARVVVGWEGG